LVRRPKGGLGQTLGGGGTGVSKEHCEKKMVRGGNIKEKFVVKAPKKKTVTERGNQMGGETRSFLIKGDGRVDKRINL